ncbi:MAG: polysaccharide pyruvyl transferase CsaB [Cyanobium sp.]
MSTPPGRPLLCGYYGEHNLGDDALLTVLLEQLPGGIEPVVTARDQEQVRRRFAVATVNRQRLGAVLAALGGCDALVLGGGSLLQDSTSFRSLVYYALLILAARRRRLPVLLWAQGLGPLRRRRSRLLVRLLLPLVSACSWRDPASAELARRLGGSGSIGSDPVWAFPSAAWQGHGGPIVLCWRPVARLDEQGWIPYLRALAVLAVASGREVLWLPFHREQDSALPGWLEPRGLLPTGLQQRSRQLEAADPAAALEVFGRAGLVLAMRLHGLILAAVAGAPCAALSYDPKVEAAAAAIGCPCQHLDVPAADDLADCWQATLDHPPSPQRIAEQRQATVVHRRLLQHWLASQPV